MKKSVLLFFIAGFLLNCTPVQDGRFDPELLAEVADQLDLWIEKTTDSAKVPRSYSETEGYKLVDYKDWTSGFPAGTLWLMAELTGNDRWYEPARVNTLKLSEVYTRNNTHDLGFMAYLSYGNAYRITGDESYRNVLLMAADTLVKRFNPSIGCIRSWDFGAWQYPVIIDNMMNLEFLFWASRETGDPKYREIAISHADNTLENHFRKDWSSWHVVSYDTTAFDVEAKETHQGYSNESAWGRGQAWGLYGFTLMYRETGNMKYLNAAKNIAGFIIPRLPDDGISYWDFNDPKIPETYRDASAAAITASALLELGTFAKGEALLYRNTANKILNTLSSESYRAKKGENGGFILKHSVGNLPGNSEVDVAINYADYYYLEALKRKISMKGNL